MRQTAGVTVLTAAGGTVEAASSPPARCPPLPRRRAPLVVGRGGGAAVVGLLFLNADLLLGPHPAFLPAFLTLVLACDLLTAVLLVEQYRAGGGPRVLALSAAYVWSAAIVVPHALVFGGLFTPTGLLGASPAARRGCGRPGTRACRCWSGWPWRRGRPGWRRAWAASSTAAAGCC